MLQRHNSRRASLYETFLKQRLSGATRYDRIAGYFQSSLLELASESLAAIPRSIPSIWRFRPPAKVAGSSGTGGRFQSA
jgi:hypothetical protein